MLSIEAIPAFNDNYIWLLSNEQKQKAAVVDPGCPDATLKKLKQTQLELEAILVTHYHHDHTGGIKVLKQHYPNAVVYGPKRETIPLCDKKLNSGENITILGQSFEVFETAGHTLGHICYFANERQNPPILFCGDTLFAGGCGRLFEGTPEQMHKSLTQLADLPPTTRIYCAHEYTQSNLNFAKAVEPDNLALQNRLKQVKRLRSEQQITLPSTIQLELETNPFLRCSHKNIVKSATDHAGKPLNGPISVFAEIRQWKDNF